MFLAHLADTRPHSPTTLANEPSTHPRIIGSSLTIYGEAGHPPYAIASALHSRRHAFVASVNHWCSFFLSPETARYLPTEDDRTKQVAEHVKHVHGTSNLQPNSGPNPSHTHQHHCERRYDYGPIMCRSTVVILCSSVARSMGIK